MRQAGYLQGLYRDAARSTEHKIQSAFLRPAFCHIQVHITLTPTCTSSELSLRFRVSNKNSV